MLIPGLESANYRGELSGYSDDYLIERGICMFESYPVYYVVEVERECFKCKNKTPVVFTVNPYAEEQQVQEPHAAASLILAERFNLWRKSMNQTQGKEVWTNHCIHCRMIQGNGFVRQIIEDVLDEANNSLDQAQEMETIIWHDSVDIQDVDEHIAQGYCGLCAKKLQPIKNKRMNGRYGKDWRGRRFHLKCWRIISDFEA